MFIISLLVFESKLTVLGCPSFPPGVWVRLLNLSVTVLGSFIILFVHAKGVQRFSHITIRALKVLTVFYIHTLSI